MKTKILLLVPTLFLACELLGQVPNYVPTTSLVTWYSFNGNANDLSLSANNGTVNGATLTTDRFSNANSAYSFNGTSDYILAGSIATYNTNSLSISFWVNYNTDFSYFNIIDYGGSNSIKWGATCGANILRATVGGVCGGTGNVLTYTTASSSWHMVTYVITGTLQTIYYDGVNVGTEANSLMSSLTCDQNNLYIGVDWAQSQEWYDGKLDDIGIWNRALTSCEVSQLYNSATSPISAVTSTSLLCIGQSATLTASGANSYTWNPGNLTGSTVVVSPTINTTYTVTGTNSITSCSNATTMTQNVSTCTGIQNYSTNQNLLIKCFPNPSNGEFSVSSDIDIDLSIINELGQMVKSISLSDLNGRKANVNKLTSGIYFVRGSNGQLFINEKIIVNK